MKSLICTHGGLSLVIGELTERNSKISFEYSDEFLNSKLEMSPFRLPLKKGLIESDARFRGYLHGMFDDSMPDGWGLLLMDRALRQMGYKAPFSPLNKSPTLRQRDGRNHLSAKL